MLNPQYDQLRGDSGSNNYAGIITIHNLKLCHQTYFHFIFSINEVWSFRQVDNVDLKYQTGEQVRNAF